ncbi:MAG TPA: diguanylate cyclase [Acidimicrobiales bacterium]|nr:diguanylate cyclase [Acidimicrobiales bacterium]
MSGQRELIERPRDVWRRRVPVVYLLAGLVVLSAYYLVPARGTGADWKVALYCLVSVSAPFAVAVGIVTLRPARPLPWILVLANQAIYAAGDVTYYVRHDLLHLTAYPSISDALYLAHYPPLVVAIVVFVRRRTVGSDRQSLIDAAMLAVTCVMLSWVFVIAPSFDTPGQDALARVTSAAYPILDIVTLSMALWLLMGPGRQARSFRVLVGALMLLVATDTLYALEQLSSGYHVGGYLDGMWAVYYLLVGAAFLDPTMTLLDEPSPVADRLPAASRFLAMGGAVMAVPAVLVFDHGRDRQEVVMVVAACAAVLFGLIIVRMMGMVRTQRQIATTDVLTGLPNRRHFETQLELDGARAMRSGEPLSFVLLDIDYFKAVNDGYGHPAGDRVLVKLAERLRSEVRAGDVLARYGGEEFALLLPGLESDEAFVAARRLTQAVGSLPFPIDRSTEVPITVSAGVVSYPRDVGSTEELAAAADRALYAAKRAGRDRIVTGLFDPVPSFLHLAPPDPVLDYLEVLADVVDRYQAPVEHGSAMARWAAAVAHDLGLDEDVRRRCGLAARLHDIGKVAVPDAVLEKEGALTPEEWELVRVHPEKGRLVVALAGLDDVADVILQHHERVDGGGYPRGLRGDEIRIEARVLSVCDTFAAMRAARPYRPALSRTQARAALRELRGTQLSAAIVDVFVSLLDRGLVGHLGHLDPGSHRALDIGGPGGTRRGAAAPRQIEEILTRSG